MKAAAFVVLLAWSAGAAAQALADYRVERDGVPAPLTREPGDPARGREIVLNRNEGACILCHSVPDAGVRFMGNIAPSLAGVGARLSAAQLRLRVIDQSRVDPNTPMPPYYRVDGLREVARAYQGKPILKAQQIEDVVSYLQALREAPK